MEILEDIAPGVDYSTCTRLIDDHIRKKPKTGISSIGNCRYD